MKALALIFLVAGAGHAAEPLIVAHRGASRDAPENTLPAFELAWAQGADAIEGDFHLTRDGQIVCIHDANTKKVAGVLHEVREENLEALRALDVGSWKGEKWAGTIIPTLSEVLDTVPRGKQIYVEVKCGPTIVPVLLKQLESSGLKPEQIVIISFKEAVIAAVEAKAPVYKTMWLSSFKKNGPGTYQPTADRVLETLARIKADGFSSSKDHIGKDFIDRVKHQGYEYHVWTVDDFKTAERFKEWGAQSITTNVPGPIKQKIFGE